MSVCPVCACREGTTLTRTLYMVRSCDVGIYEAPVRQVTVDWVGPRTLLHLIGDHGTCGEY